MVFEIYWPEDVTIWFVVTIETFQWKFTISINRTIHMQSDENKQKASMRE